MRLLVSRTSYGWVAQLSGQAFGNSLYGFRSLKSDESSRSYLVGYYYDMEVQKRKHRML